MAIRTNHSIDLKIMEMSGDPLIQFGVEVLEQSGEKVSKEQMYEVYSMWANETDKPILSKEQLGRRLNQKVKYLVAKTGAKERYWDNVSINDFWLKKLNKINKPDKNQKTLDLDTLDTSKNTIYNSLPITTTFDISKIKASKTTKNEEDTLDTLENNPFSNLNLEENNEQKN